MRTFHSLKLQIRSRWYPKRIIACVLQVYSKKKDMYGTSCTLQVPHLKYMYKSVSFGHCVNDMKRNCIDLYTLQTILFIENYKIVVNLIEVTSVAVIKKDIKMLGT